MKRVIGAPVVAMLAAACATKVAASTPGSFTTVDSRLVVQSLVPADLGRLCLDMQIFGATALTDDDQSAFRCAAYALLHGDYFGGNDSSFCAATLGPCERAVHRVPSDFGQCGGFAQIASLCTLTVGALEECMKAVAQDDLAIARVEPTMCAQSPSAALAARLAAVDGGVADCLPKCGDLVAWGQLQVGGQPYNP